MKFQKTQSLSMVKEIGIVFAPGGLEGGVRELSGGNGDVSFLDRYVSDYTGACICQNRANHPLKIWVFRCT